MPASLCSIGDDGIGGELTVGGSGATEELQGRHGGSAWSPQTGRQLPVDGLAGGDLHGRRTAATAPRARATYEELPAPREGWDKIELDEMPSMV
jgi:hypothetical protein